MASSGHSFRWSLKIRTKHLFRLLMLAWWTTTLGTMFVLALEASRMILFHVMEKRFLSLVFNNFYLARSASQMVVLSSTFQGEKETIMNTMVSSRLCGAESPRYLLHSSSSSVSVSTFACLLVAPIPCC